MLCVFLGFIFGLFIPYMARRFAKFMPATPAYALLRLLVPGKRVKREKRQQNYNYMRCLRRYYMRSFGYAVAAGALSALAFYSFGNAVGWGCAYIWILLLLSEIDRKMLLLPDILTYPLLLIGLCFSLFSSTGWVILPESVLGAVAGYILPVLASLFLVWKHPDAFGGGDIKLLCAVGAWLGREPLVYVILTACVLFGIESLIYRRKSGAFGPALSAAAIVVAFACF